MTKSTKNDSPLEHAEQVALMNKLSMFEPDVHLRTSAVPNGAWSSQGMSLNAEGVRKGYPDLIIDWPLHGYPGLRIEMKRRKKSYPGPTQKMVLRQLREDGYAVAVGYGWEDAYIKIMLYVTGEFEMTAMLENMDLKLDASAQEYRKLLPV